MTKPSLKAVADAAGVSLATASKALNGRPDVSASTRERVHSAARGLGWQPCGRPHRERERPRVAVVFDTVGNFYVPQLLEGMLTEGRRIGMDVHVTNRGRERSSGGREEGSTAWIHDMAERGMSGVILVCVPITAERVQACRQRGLALVCVDPSTAPPPGSDVATVAATSFRGGLQAIQHLVELGHRRIGMVTGPPGGLPTEERIAGYHTALRAAGITIDPQLVVQGDFRFEGGLVATRFLLGLDERPTAIFAQCDEMAMGVYEAARRMHLRIPEDLSVIGFDDCFAAQYAAPPLTTVRQPLEEMGAAAVRALRQILDGEPRPPAHFETRLIVRASTAAPAS